MRLVNAHRMLQTTKQLKAHSEIHKPTWLVGICHLYQAAQHILTKSCRLLVCQLATSGMCFIGEQMKNINAQTTICASSRVGQRLQAEGTEWLASSTSALQRQFMEAVITGLKESLADDRRELLKCMAQEIQKLRPILVSEVQQNLQQQMCATSLNLSAWGGKCYRQHFRDLLTKIVLCNKSKAA